MRLLLVEDESKLSDALAHLFKRNGFVVDVAADGETGIDLACTGVYDTIVLDRMLPKQDGLSLLKEFRSLGHDTPVIFLTARDDPEERAEGLNAGADDYLVKPFYTVELLARLRALTRRQGKTLAKNVLVFEDLVFDPHRGVATRNDEEISLTYKESQLLEVLIRNQGHVVTKENIMQKVWDFNADPDPTTINLYVHYLRKKLSLDNLVTVRGVGYFLRKQPDRAAN